MFTLNRSLATRIPPLLAGFSRQGGFKYYSGHTHESVRNFPESLSEENRNHCPKLSGIAVRSSPDFPQASLSGRTSLVLTERRDHLRELSELLSTHHVNIAVLHGGMGKKQKLSLMENINTTSGGLVILATGRYIGEGFDLAKLDTLFLTMPVSWKGVLTQYAGRLHRLHTGKKEVIIYDYVDTNIPMLARMHKRRLSGYRSIGYIY